MRYESFIFDCDGVILDSNQAKTNAFVSALEGEAREHIEIFIEYHKKNGGISRYEKFRYFYAHIAPRGDIDSAVNHALERFSQESEQAITHCNLIPGIEDLLTKIKSLEKPCHLVSGGDQREIISTFKKRNLFAYFDEILGSPASKIQNVENLVADNKIFYPCLYVGDAHLDFLIAKKFNFDFAFVNYCSEWNDWPKYINNNIFKDIFQLTKAIDL